MWIINKKGWRSRQNRRRVKIGPLRHLAVSCGTSIIVLNYTNSLGASLASLISGVLIDFDHTFEYFKHGCYKFNPKESLKRFLTADFDQIYLILHSVELCLLLWIWVLFFNKSMVLIGIAIGYSHHIFFDYLSNQVRSIFSYFYFYRVFNRCQTERIFNRKKLLKVRRRMRKGGYL